MRTLAIILFTIVLTLGSSDLHSQQRNKVRTCYNDGRKKTPFFELWGRHRTVDMKLLDREYSRGLHFGFGLGVNVFNFFNIGLSNKTVYVPGQGNTLLYANISQAHPGFNISAIMDYRLNGNFNLRFLPGIFFGQRSLDFYRQDTHQEVFSMPILSNYIEFPILLKYSAVRYTNFRPYMIAGINSRINLSNNPSEDSDRYIGLKKMEHFAEAGFGFDFYFAYFRMGTEIKFSGGLHNVLTNKTIPSFEYYRESLTSIHSNMLVITLSFEL